MKAVYPGSFDPLTFGHIEVVKRALKLFSEVTFLLAHSKQKPAFFSVDERKSFITAAFNSDSRVKVEVADGLTTDFLKKHNQKIILRALRNSNDYEYEKQMAEYNFHLYPECETVYLFSKSDKEFLSSSGVKEVFKHNGELKNFVPPEVIAAFNLKRGLK